MKRRDMLKGAVAAPFLALFGCLKPEEVKAEPEREIKEWYAWQETGYPQIDPIVYTEGVRVNIIQRLDKKWEISFAFTLEGHTEGVVQHENYQIENIEYDDEQYNMLGKDIGLQRYYFALCKVVWLHNKVRLEDADGHNIRITLGDKLNA
jgi:hypothetical protein